MLPDKFYLGRQPILDGSRQLIGYELLFRATDCGYAEISDMEQASASVIITTLTDFGIERVLGSLKGFFNVTREMLMSDALELLPRDQVVIELLESIAVSAEVVERCRQLKELGFTLALDDNIYAAEYQPLYPLCDIVKVDLLLTSPAELPGMVAQLKQWPVRLLAEKVENEDIYSLCNSLGFEFYQGYYFARPVVLKQKKTDLSRLALTRLLNQVLAEAAVEEIEETFKQNPTLTYNLLRLVNSVAMGFREKIKNLRHAIIALGHQQLKRWVMLAIFTHGDVQGMNNPLLQVAAARGKLMEQLVKNRKGVGVNSDYPDLAFMTGILSLVDVLLEVSMTDIVAQLNLADEVRLALLERGGELGSILAMAELLEQNDFAAAARLIGQNRFSMESLFAAQLDSIEWTNSLSCAA